MTHLKIAFYLASLYLSILFLVRILGPTVLEHDQIMMEIQKDATEEAKYNALRACLRKHGIKECKL